MLNEGTLVLKGVTLAQVVELVVQVLVDLAVVAVLDEKAAENTETAHPEDLAVEEDRVSKTTLPRLDCPCRNWAVAREAKRV